jgi:phosphoribosylformylglycinamidine cyclo-ligase
VISGSGAPETSGEAAYRRSGVDLEAGHRAVDLIRELAGRTSRPEVVGGIGGFAGMVKLGDGRLLVASADGVGTKLEIATLTGRFDTVGIDCVAMCANDVICTGAEPLFFLDYLAVGRLIPEEVAAIVAGVAEGCRRAGCSLLGGETAEHPGTMEPGRFDLAGFCVGIVDEAALLGPEKVERGDVLLGLPSSGLHSNGFSLVRRVLLEAGRSLEDSVPELGRTLGAELLEPTAIYVRPVLELARAGLAHAAAHITGGGWTENVPRALGPGLGARIDRTAWTPQPIFSLIAEAARVDPADLFGVLNMGIGLVVAVSGDAADQALDVCHEAGIQAAVVGEVLKEPGIRFGSS